LKRFYESGIELSDPKSHGISYGILYRLTSTRINNRGWKLLYKLHRRIEILRILKFTTANEHFALYINYLGPNMPNLLLCDLL